MKSKKGFTLIELIAVLVILAILALIVTPLVMSIIKKAKDSANKRSIDAYGRAAELAVATYLLDNNDFPESFSELTIETTGSEVSCATTVLNEDSSVYLAIDGKKNILTAIKSLPKNKMDADAEKNLRRELQNLHNLKHSNIVQILDFLYNKNYNYIILEYCNGGNLRDYVQKYIEKNKVPLNEFFIQKIIRQIAPALEYMHSKNIIHRDIKLENILLNFNMFPNIPKNGKAPQALKFSQKSLNKDFSAKITGLNFSKDLIQDNMGSTILGSPLYMSPDVVERYDAKTDKKYNTSADLWSLGVITYELLTGTTPFIGTEVNQVFQNIEKGVYKLPNKLKPSIEIISLINGLLQYYPEKRLNWEQIKEHPFLVKNVEDFTYIDLELYSDGEKKEVEINSKDSNMDNLLWIFFKCKGLEDVKVDKINEKEVKKKNLKPKLDKNKVINEEVKKATEQEKMEKEKEKEEINIMKKNAEEDKKKAEIEKNKHQIEQEKLIKEENELKNKREQLIKESEKNKKGSEENLKKKEELKKLEQKMSQIKKDKDNMEQKIKTIEQKIAEMEKLKKFTEKKIQQMTNSLDKKDNNEQYKNEIKKLNEEKNSKSDEVERLKKEEEIKEQKFKKEKAQLEKKKNEINEEKKKLEKEVNKNNEVKNKILDTDKQLKDLEEELKKKEEEKQKEIEKIKKNTEELKQQITQFNQIIEEKEKEKEEEKTILGSFIQMNKEEVEQEEKQQIQDEWEKISEKDVNFEDEDEIDVEQICAEYEIIDNYVDNETAKNEGK